MLTRRDSCWCLIGIFAGTAQAQLPLTLTLAPVGGNPVPAGETIAVEMFVTANFDIGIRIGQSYAICNLPGSPGSSGTITIIPGAAGGTTNPDGAGGPGPSSGGLSYIFGPTGLGPFDALPCAGFAHAPSVGEGPTSMVASETRYLGTLYYEVSNCAEGDFNVFFICSPSNTQCDSIPSATDITRFRDNTGPGQGNLIAYEALSATIRVQTGVCCDGQTCLGERSGQSCCDADFPGSLFFPGRTCADADPCACVMDAECDDGDVCTGEEACNVGTGECFSAQPGPVCEDGDSCTIDFCDTTHPDVDPMTGCAAKDFGRVYWSEEGVTRRAYLDGSGVGDLLANGADSLATDAQSGKLYWTAPSFHKIQRSNLDGSNVEDLVTAGPGSTAPSVLAVDSTGGRMYWVDGSDRIFRADFSGANVEVLVTLGASPNVGGIAVDHDGGKMYWTEGSFNRIRRANLDGSSIELIVSTGTTIPVAIALDLQAAKVYWSRTSADTAILRANLNGSSIEQLIAGLPVVRGLAFDQRFNYVPTGTHFNKMYWTESTAGRIRRSNLTGGNIENVATGLSGQPRGIALDLACCQLYGDIYPPPSGSGVRDVDDLLCVLDAFIDFLDCPTGDMFPCGGDGMVDVDDVLAMLDTYNLVFACPSVCP